MKKLTRAVELRNARERVLNLASNIGLVHEVAQRVNVMPPDDYPKMLSTLKEWRLRLLDIANILKTQ